MSKKRIFLLTVIATSRALCSVAVASTIQNNMVNEVVLANSSNTSNDLNSLITTLSRTTSSGGNLQNANNSSSTITNNTLSNMLFNYGDVTNITSNSKGKLFIKNFNNELSYSMGSSLQVKITKNGLETLNNTLKVNPIYFTINDKSIDITGETCANDLVNIWVDGNNYSTEANSEGDFNLPITLKNNPTPTTS